jgi:hypothetical protein
MMDLGGTFAMQYLRGSAGIRWIPYFYKWANALVLPATPLSV